MKILQEQQEQCVMVCITDQPACNDLIAAAAEIAAARDLPLVAVTVLPTGLVSEYTADRLQTLYNIAGRHGARLLVLFNDAPALTVAVTARQQEAVHLVVGSPGPGSNRFIEMIKGILPEVPLTVVDKNAQADITFPAFSEVKNV